MGPSSKRPHPCSGGGSFGLATAKHAMADTRENQLTQASGSVRVEIFDQAYNLRGSDPEYINRLAEYVDTKIRAVAQQASTVDSTRLAVLAALNIADELLMLKRKYEASGDITQRASHLAGALDEILAESRLAG
jgi:cell division protein ZapA